MAVFKIKKSQVAGIERYVRNNYGYFMRNKNEVKIVIGREFITIHIKEYYCVICNDLCFLNRRGNLIAGTRSLNWLKKYDRF